MIFVCRCNIETRERDRGTESSNAGGDADGVRDPGERWGVEAAPVGRLPAGPQRVGVHAQAAGAVLGRLSGPGVG